MIILQHVVCMMYVQCSNTARRAAAAAAAAAAACRRDAGVHWFTVFSPVGSPSHRSVHNRLIFIMS